MRKVVKSNKRQCEILLVLHALIVIQKTTIGKSTSGNMNVKAAGNAQHCEVGQQCMGRD
jgi:hypothetical protein